MNSVLSINSSTSVSFSLFSSIKERKFIIINKDTTSSTRMSNSEKFSLEQLRFNKLKLRSFKALSQGWNGYEAEPIDDKLIIDVEKLISDLDYQPQIFPTGRGSIQLEKYIDDNNLVEFEIDLDGIFMYFVKKGKEVERPVSREEINYYINELYS